MRGQESHWLIIGGTGGIGRAIATQALEHSEHVVCTGSSGESVKRMRTEFQGSRHLSERRLKVYCLKISGWLSMLKLNRWLRSQALPDIALVSYGPMIEEKLTSMLPRNWRHMSDHNLVVPGIMLSALLKRMMERGSGTIILLGGTDTDQIRGFKRIAAYAAAKTGLSVLALSAAETFREHSKKLGVDAACDSLRVICVCPDYIDTEYLCDEQRLRYSRIAGAKGLGSPEHFADFIRKIVFDRKNYPNGTIINMKNYRE